MQGEPIPESKEMNHYEVWQIKAEADPVRRDGDPD